VDGTIPLDSIDEVRERTGANYRACYEALQATGGDVVQAVLRLEESGTDWVDRLRRVGDRWVDRAGDLAWELSRARIAVRQGEREVLSIPALLGAVGAALVPGLAAVGLVAALLTRASVSLEQPPANN